MLKKFILFLFCALPLNAVKPYKPFTMGDFVHIVLLQAPGFGLHVVGGRINSSQQPYRSISFVMHKTAQAALSLSYKFGKSSLRDALDYIDLKKRVPQLLVAVGMYWIIKCYMEKNR
jgi:hypothetical protein